MISKEGEFCGDLLYCTVQREREREGKGERKERNVWYGRSRSRVGKDRVVCDRTYAITAA